MKLQYKWIHEPEGYVPGITAAVLPSGIVVCTIRKKLVGIFTQKTEFTVLTAFKHRGSGRPIGGYRDTFEEAQKLADDLLNAIFGDTLVS